MISERETASGYPLSNELLTFIQGQPSLLGIVAAIFFVIENLIAKGNNKGTILGLKEKTFKK